MTGILLGVAFLILGAGCSCAAIYLWITRDEYDSTSDQPPPPTP
jgi:hypothetical protein